MSVRAYRVLWAVDECAVGEDLATKYEEIDEHESVKRAVVTVAQQPYQAHRARPTPDPDAARLATIRAAGSSPLTRLGTSTRATRSSSSSSLVRYVRSRTSGEFASSTVRLNVTA